jgi:rifampicin phosphotransferase
MDLPHRIEEGEVLVATLTTPAWTPLFAHQYSIPAVVGTGEVTRRLRDGQAVTVDGGAGTVELSR